MLGGGFPLLLPPDTGGGTSTRIDGSFAGPTLPAYMDEQGMHGELVVLKVEPVSGSLPENPFILRKSVERHIAGVIEGAFPEARGRTYALKVRNKDQIAKLMSLDRLIDGTQVKVTKHTGLNSVRCVINCRGMENMTDQECLEHLTDQKVTYVRRITRRIGNKIENTGTVILTIDGTSRPEHVDVGYQRCKTRPYYPSPMLCYRCYNFGHTKARCQQTVDTCGNCGQQHEIVQGERCSAPAFCVRCKSGDHGVSSRKCPVYVTEDAIQHIRVDKGLSYPAAKRLFDAANGKGSFASVTTASKDKVIQDLTSKVEVLTKNCNVLAETLKQQIAEKDKEIAELKNSQRPDGAAGNSQEFYELRKMIVDLQAEVRKKDERIKALESKGESNNRIELTRKNGTIEDLVKRVKDLEMATAAKDRENENLRTENQAYRELITTFSTVPQYSTAMQSSQTRDQIPTTTESKQLRQRKPIPTKKQLVTQNIPLTLTPPIQTEYKKDAYTGTTKKVAAQQPSGEIDPKRIKSGSPSRTLDSDDEMNDDSVSSDEGDKEQLDPPMEP